MTKREPEPKTSPQLRFASKDIKEQEGLAFSGKVSSEDLAVESLYGEAKAVGPASVELEFAVGGSHILMTGRVQSRWQFACNRCLAPHELTLGETLEETYPLSQETIDVTEDVRQALALSLPDRSLCRKDCQGLCAKCGANKNEGPCRCPVN